MNNLDLPPRKLLTIDNDPKTAKGTKKGYLTAIQYLSPFTSAGIQVCPTADIAGCWRGCLNTAGHGGMAKAGATFAPFGIELPDNIIQRARIRRTRYFANHRELYFGQLIHEIHSFVKLAKKRDLIPCVRLNGTSDIRWEREFPEVFERFSNVQFYDYTKIPNRLRRKLPDNYHLTLSYSEASPNYSAMVRHWADKTNANVAVVFRKELPADFMGRTVINADESDLRFLDPAGVVCGLKAKGKARQDKSGFVMMAR